MDFYKEVRVRGYRSFFAEQAFKPCFPRPGLIGYNIIVGPNNSGKSSILHILNGQRWTSLSDDDFNQKKPRIKIATTKNKAVEIEYNLNSGPRLSILPKDGNLHPNLFVLFINANRSLSFSLNGQIGMSYGRSGQGIKPQFLNVLRGLSTSQLENRPLFLVEILGELQEADMVEEFCSLVREFVPDFGSYRIRIRNGATDVEYKDISGREVSPEFLSDGTKAVLLLVAFAFYFRIDGEPNMTPLPSIIVIDEPERSLQPDALRKMHKLLLEISKNIQVIVSTHSPYFVSWLDILNGASIHRIYRGEKGKSKIKKLDYGNWQKDDDIRAALSAYTQPRRLLHYDVLSREALFSNSCLLVEGQDDALILRNFIEEKNLQLEYQLFGYGADGASKIKGWIKVLKALGIKVAVLVDDDGEGKKAASRAKEILGSQSVKNIKTEDIRDKKAVSLPEKNGIANEKGIVKDSESNELINLLENIQPS